MMIHERAKLLIDYRTHTNVLVPAGSICDVLGRLIDKANSRLRFYELAAPNRTVETRFWVQSDAIALVPYPFCRTPSECAGKGYCTRDPACDN